MQDLLLRGQLLYDMFAGPTFCRFLPLRDAAQWGRLCDTRFEVRLYTDPSQHRGWVTDIDLDKIDRHTNPSTRGIFIELRTAIDDDIATALAGDQKAGAAAHDFAAEVLGALRVVHGVFVAFVRHEHMQHWLGAWENHRLGEGLDQRLLWYDARCELPDGRWKYLHSQCPRCLTTTSAIVMRDTIPLTKDAWSLLEKAVQSGHYRAKPHRRLLANAFAQFDRHELRAAIVEAVATWEMVLGSVVPTRLAEQHVRFDEVRWKAMLEKLGLRGGTDLAVALLPGLLDHYAEALRGAIECRNNVIHNGATKLDPAAVAGWLWALRAAIGKCEGGGAF
jgi:hypothetical protein